MIHFPVNTVESAPEQSRPVLRELQQTFGMIPNIAGTMSASPILISGFLGIFQKVHSGTFTEAQIQTLLLTNAVTNACTWAVAFHTALALKEGLIPADVQAIRERRVPKDAQHAALSILAKTVIEKRGHLDQADIQAFVDAGFRQDQVLELLTVSAASTITNYTGSITNPPLEAMLEEYVWQA